MTRIPLRKRYRTLMAGLGTVLGVGRQGFFIPYRFAASVPRHPPAYAAFEALFESQRDAFRQVLNDIADDGEALANAVRGPLAGHWSGGYFGALDAAAAWAIVRRARPRRIVEVGSGSSTHTLAAAVAGADTRPDILCIDPVPRSAITTLGVRWERAVLSEVHLDLFRALEPGDVAFFDSSHVLFQGTDVDIIQNRILPELAPGVLVHVHDVFLPDPYPQGWALRAYTEQLGLGGWLFGGARVLFSSHFAGTRMPGEVSAAFADLPHGQKTGGSLWFRR